MNTQQQTQRLPQNNHKSINTLTLNPTPRLQSLQSLPLLSPNRRPTPTGLPKQLGMLTITRYSSHLTAHNPNQNSANSNHLQISPAVSESYDIEDYYDEEQQGGGQGPYAYEDESEFYSPKDRDVYYDENTDGGVGDNAQQGQENNLPPVPTYSESQMAYYPHGIKRLPHFHPQKFSRRLRTLMDQRRKPCPLYLDVEPNTKIFLDTPLLPQHNPLQSPRRSNVLQSLLRILFPRLQVYRQVDQQEEDVERYAAVDEDESWWGSIDHRVVFIGILGLLLLGLSIAAWTIAVLRA